MKRRRWHDNTLMRCTPAQPRRSLTLIAALALFAVGCGGDGDASDDLSAAGGETNLGVSSGATSGGNGNPLGGNATGIGAAGRASEALGGSPGGDTGGTATSGGATTGTVAAGASNGGATNGAPGAGASTNEPTGGATASGGSNTAGAPDTGVGGAAPTEPLAECDPYSWPKYEPDINYDFRAEYKDIDPSKFKVYLGCDASVVAGNKASGWFNFIWGPNRNPSITDADIDRMLLELNEDMAYARDVMGWPPDRLNQEGYFSNVYLFGSGLCTDNASNTEKGGWQSGINGYPMVLLSYYPIVNHDRGGITHEAIHTIMSSMKGPKAPWFNEGGNTWLQMNMSASQTGKYGVGFLDGAPFLAPHMPIECYSGWLQDGTFGGPGAEGVERQKNGTKVSTWRDYLGGNQYNSAFSHFLALNVSTGSNAWVWANTEHVNVLETLAGGLGVEQTQRAIMEYRARQALVDFGPWSDAFKVPINNNWGRTIGAEDIPGGILEEPPPHKLSFYAATTTAGDTLTPATDTLPGWSGANQIPLSVSDKEVRVEFEPRAENMRLQLVYRAADGSAVYGQPVSQGSSCLRLDKAPKDAVVVAVVSNVDHLYQGEETRKRKHDYRIRLISGATGTASIQEKHY